MGLSLISDNTASKRQLKHSRGNDAFETAFFTARTPGSLNMHFQFVGETTKGFKSKFYVLR